MIAPTDTGIPPAIPCIKYDPETGCAGRMISFATGSLAFGIRSEGAEKPVHHAIKTGERAFADA